MKEYVHSALVKRWEKAVRKARDYSTSRSYFKLLMLYAFLPCTICVPLQHNIIKRNLVALLSEHHSYFSKIE